MSTIIQVLEQMGSDASLQNEQAIKQLLATTEVDVEQVEAIISKNITSLERQLDVCPDVVCMMLPAEEEGEQNDESDDKSDDESKAVINV